MKNSFVNEIERIVNLRNVLIFIGISLLSISFSSDGIDEFNIFRIDVEYFKTYENQSVEQYVSMEIYGAYGFRILYYPSPLSIFYKSQHSTVKLNGEIGIKENKGVNKEFEGRAVFIHDGLFNGFIGFIIIAWSLVMFIMGKKVIASPKHLKFFKKLIYIIITVFTRLLILNIALIVLYIEVVLYSQNQGIIFSQSNISMLVLHCGYSIVLFSFFYFLGLISLSIKKFNLNKSILPAILWIIFVIVLPDQSNKWLRKASKDMTPTEKIKLEKLTNAQQFERMAKEHFDKLPDDKKIDKYEIAADLISKYLKDGYARNIELDNKLINESRDIALIQESQSLLSPITNYILFSEEIISEGYYNYRDFILKKTQISKDFFDYYINQRYKIGKKTKGKVMPFLKGDENIFYATGKILKTASTEVMLLCLYILICGVVFIIITTRTRRPLKKIIDLKNRLYDANQKALFVYCGSSEDRNQLFYSLDQGEYTLIDNYKKADFDSNIRLRHLFKMSKIKDLNGIYENLKCLNVDISGLDQRIESVSEEILSKVILSIRLTEDNKDIVLNDFTKGFDGTFDKECRQTISRQIDKERKVFYLSEKIYDTLLRVEEIKLDKFSMLPIDFNEISLK